jgi:hypothetical protein
MALAQTFENELNKRSLLTADERPVSRTVIESAAAEVYATLGRSAPVVIQCRSLYQMVTLPSLLIGLFFSDAWRIVSGALCQRQFDDSWEHDYEQAWEALWAHGGQQLLHGMKQTSRISAQYWQLEAGLFQQCKSELKHWLKSEKIAAFEETLPREIIFRKYWALQLWHLNFALDRLRILEPELAQLLTQEKHDWQEEMEQFLPYQDRILQRCRNAAISLASLLIRMGAEPVNQMKHVLWMPQTIPYLSAAEIWLDNVNTHAFTLQAAEIKAWNRLADTCLAVICLDHVVFVCEKPSLFNLDEWGRLHSSEGPALLFADGFREYAWHGLVVDARLIEEPESISIEEIDSCANAELRRVLIERYGQARYLQDSGAEKIHQDECGTLFRKDIPGDEPLLMVKVVNSSPEPDGSFKDYFLRVPPESQTAKQAVAWTFGFDEEDYTPLAES